LAGYSSAATLDEAASQVIKKMHALRIRYPYPFQSCKAL
jgi:hypothetical protein